MKVEKGVVVTASFRQDPWAPLEAVHCSMALGLILRGYRDVKCMTSQPENNMT